MNMDLSTKEARATFNEVFLRESISGQIRTLRKRWDWTQGELARRAGLYQEQVSRLECLTDPSMSLPSIPTLSKIAGAFDVVLIVRFAPFSELLAIHAGGVATVPESWIEEFGDTTDPGPVLPTRIGPDNISNAQEDTE